MQKLHDSSWVKFCERDLREAAWRLRQADEHGPLVPKLISEPFCFTVADVRTEAGQPVVAVALIEREGLAKRLLRVTVTLPHAFAGETRIIIDAEPIRSRFYSRIANRCTAGYSVCTTDYEATPELIDKLKKGQMLQMQAAPTVHGADALPLCCRLPMVAGTPLPEPTRDRQAIQRRSRRRKKYWQTYGTNPGKGPLRP
jgi:invasion protein IalB